MDQRGQAGVELDPVVLPPVRGQPGEAGVVHAGLQPGQLHEKVGLAGVDETLVTDQYSDPDDQDWRTVGMPRQETGVPTG